jgi:hypothetical protein
MLNTQFIGLDSDLTGKWLCTSCRPCPIRGNYDEVSPDRTGDWFCSNCPEGEDVERPTKLAPPQSQGPKQCAICSKSFGRHERESRTCGGKYLFLAKILMGFLPQIMFQRRNLQQIRKMRTALVTS